jgi:predicted nucleic acid-binding protein
MRFLVDADLPRDTAALLEEYGHVGIDVRDIRLRSADDSVIANYALANQLCILTADWGFSDIRVFPPDRFAGIVVLGLPARATGAATLDLLRVLLDRPDLIDLLYGRLAIVEIHRVRLRPPP